MARVARGSNSGRMGRVTIILCVPVLALATAAPALGAAMNCARASRCPDASIVANAEAVVEAACPCSAVIVPSAYRRCWQRQIKANARAVGRQAFPLACQAEVRRRF